MSEEVENLKELELSELAKKTDNVIIKILCRRVMVLEIMTDQLIDVLKDAGIITLKMLDEEVEKESIDED